jgi:hypothetical protein
MEKKQHLNGFREEFFWILKFLAGRGYGQAVRRVRAEGIRVVPGGYEYDGFFPEKTLTCPSHVCTHVPAYTWAQVRVPRVTETGRRVRIESGGYKQTTSLQQGENSVEK